MESGGRRVDKRIMVDVTTLQICSDQMVEDICRKVPLLSDYAASYQKSDPVVNTQLYRMYIVRYLHSHPIVAKDQDLIVAQREVGECGLPIEVYFFLTDKAWAEFERIQSDIFDHLQGMAAQFGLKLYQLPPD